MPKIAELKEIGGDIWCRVRKPGEFESGIALWTPVEQAAYRKMTLLEAADVLQQARQGEIDTDLRSLIHRIQKL